MKIPNLQSPIPQSLTLLLLLFSAFANAQTPLQTALTALAKDSVMLHAAWSFRAVNATTGVVLAEKDPEMALLAASNMKLVTTAAALKILGADSVLKTEVWGNMVLKGKVFTGSIAIIGCGDPSFCSQHIAHPMSIDSFRRDFFKKIKKAYPKLSPQTSLSISNYNTTTEIPGSWEYGDLTESYGVTANGFNFFDNQIKIQYKANDSIFKARLTYIATQPDFGMRWHDAEADKIVYVAESDLPNRLNIVWKGERTWHLEGTVHRSDEILNLTFANPYIRAQLVYNLCDSLHIQPTPNFQSYSKKGWKQVFHYDSPTIYELVKTCNEESINLYAEALLKITAQDVTLKGVSKNGADVVQLFIAKLNEKNSINAGGTHFEDGSGLSRHNLLTTRFLTDFLVAVQKDTTIAQNFYTSLPISGETGSLKKWFKDQPAKGKIHAKTGTMSRVLAYSGYTTNAKNEKIVFSLIVNNFDTALNATRFKLTSFLNVLIE
jgi:serine-type D-Ala-D-Ala carboxypeptidase/endopeptidase (penicillin-binding protein 4)